MEFDPQRIGIGAIALGSIFIGLLYFSLLGKIAIYLKDKSYSSLIGIPLVGPFFINLGQWLLGVEWYWFILPWIIDFGTILFIIATPWIFKDWWQTSRFTRIATYADSRNNIEVQLYLHQNQIYLLRKKWQREKGEYGVSELGEVGHYEESPTTIKLAADYNPIIRVLVDTTEGYLAESESGFPEDYAYIKSADYSLQGFTLVKK